MDDRSDKPKTGQTSDPRPLTDSDANPAGRDAKRSNGETAAPPSGIAARGRSPLFGN